jgi:hypothetical protein
MRPDKAYSTASIGKAHLARMGIQPLANLQPDFPAWFHGLAMEGYYGGRTEAHIRLMERRITYLDVLSMYPTNFVLQCLWWFVVARGFEIESVTSDVRNLVSAVRLDDLFKQDIWPRIPGLVRIKPDLDLLPVRADYRGDGTYQIGLNHLRARPMWYSLADVIASKLRTGRPSEIEEAYCLVPKGIQSGLRPMSLRGAVSIDPATQDFFKVVIEARQRIKDQEVLSPQDEALEHFLKILANATSYGIFGEFNEIGGREFYVEALCGNTFKTRTAWFEKPGKYCNPYIATCVTGAARLLLTMIELCAKSLGESYVTCDTDSMTITESNGEAGEEIVRRFETLNPYAFGGSILKIEPENYDVGTKVRRPLYAVSLASKRYVLFNRDESTEAPIIRRASEHGLGHLLPPNGFDRESWATALWEYALRWLEDHASPEPGWFDEIAVAQLSISSPYLLGMFPSYKRMSDRLKPAPYNFMLVGFTAAQPEGLCRKHRVTSIGCRDPSPCRFRAKCPLVKPVSPVTMFTKDRTRMECLPWWDAHSGSDIEVESAAQPSGRSAIVSLKTYGDVFLDFIEHAEMKAADASGEQAGAEVVGELRPLYIDASDLRQFHIGKEARNLEIAQALGIAGAQNIEYDAGWPQVRESLKCYPRIRVAAISGISRSQVYALLHNNAQPHESTMHVLVQTLAALEKEHSQVAGVDV